MRACSSRRCLRVAFRTRGTCRTPPTSPLAREAARIAVSFRGSGFAPTRVRVELRGEAPVRLSGDERRLRRVEVATRATAELAPDVGGLGMPAHASGGGYSGPLAYRQGKPTPHLFSGL
jgi:hypothetical protein